MNGFGEVYPFRARACVLCVRAGRKDVLGYGACKDCARVTVVCACVCSRVRADAPCRGNQSRTEPASTDPLQPLSVMVTAAGISLLRIPCVCMDICASCVRLRMREACVWLTLGAHVLFFRGTLYGRKTEHAFASFISAFLRGPHGQVCGSACPGPHQRLGRAHVGRKRRGAARSGQGGRGGEGNARGVCLCDLCVFEELYVCMYVCGVCVCTSRAGGGGGGGLASAVCEKKNKILK